MKSTHTSPKDEKPKLKIIIFFYFHQPHINPHFMFFLWESLAASIYGSLAEAYSEVGIRRGYYHAIPPHPTFFCDSYSFIIYQIMSPPSNGRSVGLSWPKSIYTTDILLAGFYFGLHHPLPHSLPLLCFRKKTSLGALSIFRRIRHEAKHSFK